MTEDEGAKSLRHSRRVQIRFLLLSHAFLAILALASGQVPTMNALMLGAASLFLAFPVMLALWHRATARRLLQLQSFQPGRGLHWWGSRRFVDAIAGAILSLALTTIVLLQSAYFSRVEWTLVLLLPWLYLAVSCGVDAVLAKQFARPVYAQSWTQRATCVVVVALLSAIWAAATYAFAEGPTASLAVRVSTLQSSWPKASSGIVKWALDGGAWVQAGMDSIRQLPADASVRLFAAMAIAPVSLFGHLAFVMAGLSLPRSEIRRVFGQRLTDDDLPPPVGPTAAAILGAVSTLGIMLVLFILANTDSHLKTQESPFEVRPIVECERIGGYAYQLNTIQSIESLLAKFQRQVDQRQSLACRNMSDIEAQLAQRVDAYLNWYFGLGAEWLRLVTMLTGDIDQLLRFKFNDVVFSDPKFGLSIEGFPAVVEQQWADFAGTRLALLDLLAENRLVASASQCKVIKEWESGRELEPLDAFKARMAGGAGAGALAGGLAAKIAAKAMGKASMKSAAKVLAKAAAKKGAAAAVGSAAGAAIGSAVPVVGTAIGAALGGLSGLAVGIAVDFAALYAEEKLTRESMRADLLSAVTESLDPWRRTFACK